MIEQRFMVTDLAWQRLFGLGYRHLPQDHMGASTKTVGCALPHCYAHRLTGNRSGPRKLRATGSPIKRSTTAVFAGECACAARKRLHVERSRAGRSTG